MGGFIVFIVNAARLWFLLTIGEYIVKVGSKAVKKMFGRGA